MRPPFAQFPLSSIHIFYPKSLKYKVFENNKLVRSSQLKKEPGDYTQETKLHKQVKVKHFT